MTFNGTTSFSRSAIATGWPAAMLGGDYLTFDPAWNTSGGAVTNISTGNSGVLTRPEIIVVLAVLAYGSGPPALRGDLNVISTVVDPANQYTICAWRTTTSKAVGGAQVTLSNPNASNDGVLVPLGLLPETRFAPNRPYPDMPPGMAGPAAWQFTPLPRGGKVTATGVYETPATTTAELTRQAAKTVTVTVTATGTTFFGLIRQFTVTVTGTTFFGLIRQFTVTVTATGTTFFGLIRQFTVTVTATGTTFFGLIRQFTVTVTATGTTFFGLIRQFTVTVTATAALVIKRGYSITLSAGAPLIRWAAGAPLIRWAAGALTGRWRSGPPR